MPSKKVKLQECRISTQTVERIHQVILAASNISEAATVLGVGIVTLASHLSKFIVDGELLSFDVFKRLSVELAKQIWGADYRKAMVAPLIELKGYAGSYLHEIARCSQSVREAAIKLGVMDHTLTRYLSKFSFNGNKLTFHIFKKLSVTQAADVFGGAYDQFNPSQRKNLTSYIRITNSDDTLSELTFTTIVDSDAIYELSGEESDFFLIEDEDKDKDKSFHELADMFVDQFSSGENGVRFFSVSSSEPVDVSPHKRIRPSP